MQTARLERDAVRDVGHLELVDEVDDSSLRLLDVRGFILPGVARRDAIQVGDRLGLHAFFRPNAFKSPAHDRVSFQVPNFKRFKRSTVSSSTFSTTSSGDMPSFSAWMMKAATSPPKPMAMPARGETSSTRLFAVASAAGIMSSTSFGSMLICCLRPCTL